MIDELNWRYAVKKYSTEEKVNEESIAMLKEAIRLAPSSHGLQPYKVLFITNEATRAQLSAASYNQSQVTEASHLVVFAIETNVNEAYIDNYFKQVCNERNCLLEGNLLLHRHSIVKSISKMTDAERRQWATSQAYLALGMLLFAAAEMKIDANPMEGFIPNEYDKLLGLHEKGLHAVVIACIGYRHKADHLQHLAKVRKPAAQIFINI